MIESVHTILNQDNSESHLSTLRSTLLGGAMSAFGLGTAALVLGSYGAASLHGAD